MLYSNYNHERDFKLLLARLIAENAKQQQAKEFYSRMELNIQQHMLGGWLILLDCKEARNYLMISAEQDEQISQLYNRYNACVQNSRSYCRMVSKKMLIRPFGSIRI